mgnify:CR=1 FL=1
MHNLSSSLVLLLFNLFDPEKEKDEDKKIPMYDENTMETNIPGIYLAGVICGGMETHKWFIENSRIHAKLIVADIIG